MPDRDITSTVVEYYETKLAAFGPTARGVDWKDEQSQQKRFEQLLRVLDIGPERFTILDFGCGYGALFAFLRTRGFDCDYTGYDPSVRMIEQARAGHPNGHFTSVWEETPAVDFVIASGVFNVRLNTNTDAWRRYVDAMLAKIDGKASQAWAVNFLTGYADAERKRDDLYYPDPWSIFDPWRRIPRWVSLLHDYDLYEFTVGVRRQPL
jgi:SAM-dependent methyltransferase